MTDKERIKDLEAKLAVYENSPLVDSYMAIYTQIADWNTALKEKNVVNILDNKEDKAFDTVSKYFDRIVAWNNNLKTIREQMTASEAQEIEDRTKRLAYFTENH